MFSRGKLAGEHVPSSRMARLRWFGLTEVDEPRKVCGADSDSSPSLFTESILLRLIAMCAFFGAGALLLGFSPPAHAVEATFVSNAGQSSDVEVDIGNLKYAQGFETGDTSGGYDLTSVEVNLSDAGNQDLTVQVREARFISGVPAPATSALYTLTPPTTLGTGFQKFTAPGNATLDPNTDYFVVVAPGSFDPQDVAEWRATHSSAQDNSGAADWRIHNRRLILFSNGWDDNSGVHKIRINAENTAPTSGDAEVATHKNENYGFRKNDFEFDDDDDHRLDHISITSLPGKGTLSLYTGDITVTPLDVTVAELDEGKLRYNPPTDASTPNDIFTTFEFKVSDGYEDSASAYTFTMKNKGPTIVGPDEISVEERTSTDQEIGSYSITVPSGYVATWEVSRNDADDFSVLHTTSAGGQQALSVAFENKPDAEEPDDDDADNVYKIRLEVTANSLTDSLDVTVTVTDRNEYDPTVTGSAEIDYAENGTDVIGTYTIDDLDFSAVAQDFVLDLTGDDADKFTLERTDNDDGTVTAELNFNAPPDYEAPGDSDSANDYEVTVSVSDGSKTGDLDIIVTVTDQNDAPTADAGDDRTVDEGAAVTLDGSASSDPEGADLTYAWTQTAPDSGLGSAVTLDTTDPRKPTFIAPELSATTTLTFSLAVGDGVNTSTADTVDITVTADNDAPTADASGDQTVDEGDTVTLNGSASSDPEGADLTYTWTQTAPDSGEGSAVTLNTTDPGKPTFIAPELSATTTLTFSLTVGDGVNTSTADTVDINVTADNDAPTADASGDQTVDEGDTVTLNGSASSDPEGADLTYTWTQTAPDSGLGSAVTLSDETTASPSFTAPDLLATTTLTFSLTVGDGVNTSTADTVDITVTADNDAPTADAGGDQTVGDGDPVTLDGSASSDPEGADLTYVWTQTAPDSGLGSAVTLSDETTASPGFTAPTELLENLTLTFSLTVNDGVNASTADTVDITVTAGDNDAPTADAGDDQTVAEGAAVTLDGSASSDPEGADLTYVWTQTAPDSGLGSAVTLSDETTASPSFTAPTELLENLTLTFSLTVNDGTQDSTADTVDITVTAGDNDAPTADASGNQAVGEGAAVTLDGSASSDPEGADLTYVWTQTAPDSGLGSAVPLDTTDPDKPTFTAPELLATTTLTFSLTVGDGVNTSAADTVDITVTADNDAPTADASGDQTVAEGAAVTLDGSASSDPEGADLTYTWTQTAPDSGLGSAVTLSDETTASPSFTAPDLLATTTLTFSLTVGDGVNTSAADTVDITVTAGTNDAPTADAGGDQTVGEGEPVTLDGSDSSDPEGADLTYAWTQTAPDSGEGSAVTLSDATTASPSFTAPTELLENLTLTFSLTVGDGTKDSAADTVDITVTAGTNDAPTADAGDDRTVAEGAAVTLDGSDSSDPEGADLTYVWTQTAPDSGLGSAVTLSDETTASPSFTAPDLLATTTLTFSLTVGDGVNTSTADTVDITVTADNDAPTADAGGDQTVGDGDPVTLDGSASSDPEGADLTYVWTQTAPDSGLGSAVTLSDETTASPGFTAPELLATTTLTFSLTVGDGVNTSTADTVDITVTADNDAPTADAGGDQTVGDGDPVTLDGSASSDPEGADLTYVWTQTAPDSGLGSAVTLSDETTASPSFTAPTELLENLTLTFSLTVNDGTQDSTADTVDITVTAGDNDAPTADAGGNQAVGEGAAVTLDGSASSDPEGADLTYVWTQTAPDSGLGSAVTLSDETTASPSFTAPTELLENLTLTFSLTVNDGTQDSTADTVDITVTAGDNDAPTADAGGNQAVGEGAAVTLDGSASSDPEGADLTYVWTQTAPDSGEGSAVTLNTTDPGKPTFIAPELSATTTLTFSLTVGDGVNTSTADTVDITVTADNDAPTADAGGDQTVGDGDPVTLDGSASSDPEGTALTYVWTQTAPDSGLGSAVTLSDETTASPGFTAPTELLENLTLTFSLTVNDGVNASTADTVDITVTAGDNDAPTADAGDDQTVAEGAAVTLDGSASSDPEGATLTYVWTQTAPDSGLGSAVTLSDETTASPSFTAPTELLENLTLTFSLTVSDGVNTSTADTVDITVIAVPAAPAELTATAGDAQVALAWDDPGNNTINKYQVSMNGSMSFADIVGSNKNTTEHTITGLDNGTEYTFALRAVNDSGPGAVSTVSATPDEGTKQPEENDAPTAHAGDDQTVDEGDAVILDGSASSDPEGATLTYDWTQTAPDSGEGSAVTLNTTDPGKPTFIAPELSATTTLTFSLTVNDGNKDSTADTVDINVTADNDAPTADASGDQTVDEGDTVTLNGSASSDPEGADLTYTWTQTAPDSGLGSAVTLSDETTASPSFTAPDLLATTTLTFSLTVGDGVNTSTADTVDITVTADNDAPTADASGNQTVAEGAAVTLDGSASSDPEGTALTYVWTQTAPDSGLGSAVTLSDETTASPSFTAPTELLENLTLTFSLTVNDGTQDSTADTVDITVTAGDNDAPTADAGGNQAVGEGAAVTLDGSASSDPEGADLTYVWTQTAPDSGLGSAVPLDTTDPDKPTFTAPELLATTTLTFSLTVGDGVNTSAADTVDITVTADNDAPTADASGDQTVAEGAAVTLDGSASSDPEGATLTYVWTQTAPDSGLGSAVPLDTTDPDKPTFTAPELSATTTLTFSLTVNDGNKDSTADTVDINVTADNDAPTADASGDQTVAEGAAVTLDGSASSDPEGATLTYVWTQTAPDSGLGSAVPLSDATTASPSFTAPELLATTTLTFSLTVGDGVNTSTADTVDITVTADNDAPTADASGNQTVGEGDPVTLDGSASSDPEGATLTYAWTQTAPDSGEGSAVTLSDATTASPSFTAPTELLENLTLTFSLTVSDGVNTSTADTVDITVTAGDNDAPTADASGDQTVAEGAAVTLDGSASSDPEGATLTYVWTQTAPDSGLGSAVTLSDATTATPSFTAPTELLENLKLTFSLTVDDGVNASDADTVDITVTAGDNDAPTAHAGGDQTVGEGAAVTLDGSASSDPEGAALTYAWTQTAPDSGLGSAVTLSDATTASPSFTAPTELLENLTLTFSLTVGDGTKDSTAVTVDITVTAGDNDAPTAHAGDGQTVDEGNPVTLDGSASLDPEGADLTYVWTQTAPASGLGSAVTLSDATTATPSFTAPTELLENLTLTFSLTVGDGVNTSTADTVDITVTAGNNDAPTAHAGDDQTVDEGDTVTLDGSASSDPEGADLTYAWTQTAPDSGEGSAVTLSDATTASPSFTAPTELLENLTLTFSLTVGDGVNTSAADTVDITVTAGTNDAPTADAGGDQTVGEGEPVTLDGSDSSDPEGADLTYAWTQTAPDSGEGSAVTLSDATTASPSFTAPTELLENLTLTFSLTVGDGTKDSAADTVDITVTAGTNDAPTADAGDDRTVAEGAAVTLDGSDSSDPEGADLTYAWTQTAPDSGEGSAVTLSDATTASPSFTAPTELLENLTLTFSLTVNDGTKDSTADTVDITVTAGDNDAPTAHAGGDQTVDEGDMVTLDGSASSDPEGADLTYAWTQTAPDSGEGSAVTLNDATTASPSFTAPTELLENLTLTFSLTVNDGTKDSTADTVDITVTAQVDFVQQQTAEQASKSQEAILAVVAASTAVIVQAAIQSRFERFRNLNRPEISVEELPPAESDHGAEAPLPGEPEPTSLEGAADTPQSGRSSADQETGTPGRWLRNVALGALGSAAGFDLHSSGSSVDSAVEPGGSIPGQDRHYGSRIGAPLSDDTLVLRDYLPNLSGLSFEAPLRRREKQTNWAPVLWVQHDLQQFNGDLRQPGLVYRGGLEAAHLGLDLYASDRVLAGLSFMRSWGDLEYSENGADGVLEGRMDTVHPYLYWQPNEKLSMWGIGGLGGGQVSFEETGRTHDIDADFRMLAGGVRWMLSSRGHSEWGVRTDAFTAQLGTGATAEIANVSGEVRRGRLMLEWVYDRELSVGRLLSLQTEAGGRIDDGDANRGAGMETGFRLGYLDANRGLELALHGRVLAVHESDYRDWGVGLQASWDPGEKQRGFRSSFTSSWGLDGGGRTTVWENADAVTSPARIEATGNGLPYQFGTELAYAGLTAPGLPGLLTPYTRITWRRHGRELAVGSTWSLSDTLPAMSELGISMRENQTGPAEFGVFLRVSIPLGGSQDAISGRDTTPR